MPPLKPGRIYWDSDVFLSYFSKHPDRFSDLQTILAEVRESQEGFKIVTSVLAKAEAAYIAEEKTAPEDYPNVEATLDEFWANTRIVELIEVSEDVATEARRLTRIAFLNGWRRLRANDAIHLGTAVWVMKHVEVIAFHTYNIRDYEKFREVVPFRIEVPRPTQPQSMQQRFL
jgi:predicted nucleic acid-binding protein